jgi:hypothetical protein
MNVSFRSKNVSAASIDQKTRRRRNTLFRKATEYCSECFADIQMIIRLKKTGDVYILTSKSKGWPLSEAQLVWILYSFFLQTWCILTNNITGKLLPNAQGTGHQLGAVKCGRRFSISDLCLVFGLYCTTSSLRHAIFG